MPDSAQRSPAPATKVNKEAVKVLVQQNGIREGARIAGLNENTVLSWAHRYGWQPAINPQSAPSVRSGNGEISNRIADRLASNEKQTRLSLSRAHRIHAARAARGKLAPKETLQVAQGAAITHGWRQGKDQDQANVAVNIAILSV